jgi:spermidine synthase
VAVLLFAVPSLLLGIVSPYLAKFAITSTKTSGKTVAGLSTANAVGSILGTFATGFILFGLIGGQIILVTLIIVAVGVSWLIAPKEVWKIRVAASLVLALVAILPVAMTRDNDTVTIDTATARYLVARGAVDGREATMLVAGPKGVQSAVFTDGSEDLVFWYQQQIAQVVDNLHDEDDEFRVLVLGGGAFTTPEYLAKKYPRAHIDVVEIDPGLFNISKRYFGITGASNMRVYGEDARSFVRRAEGNYDFVLVDVFNDIEVPWQFVTREFGNEVGGLLEDGGVVAINMVAAETGGCGQIYDALYGIYARNLPYRYAVKHLPNPETVSNMELVFSKQELQLQGLGWKMLDKEIGTTYTDKFAPIEHLLLQCYR